ncbi:MAG TPA: hypothetical protein VNK04_22000 [Gemmataceae bacterium]|nr:hypothetical protein [Gemmataceae bacterium]
MNTWYRVFGQSDVEPSPAALLAFLQTLGRETGGNFRGDDRGWFRAELLIDGTAAVVERYLADEEGIRGELNAWAAWVEATGEGPAQLRLMERLIGTRQLFVLRGPATEQAEALCRYLARSTDGVYQADGRGFFDPTGNLLVAEEDEG